MIKKIVKILLIIFLVLFLAIFYLSIFGIKTDKFNNQITKSILKIDNKKISRSAISNKNLYLITDNSIIKLN